MLVFLAGGAQPGQQQGRQAGEGERGRAGVESRGCRQCEQRRAGRRTDERVDDGLRGEQPAVGALELLAGQEAGRDGQRGVVDHRFGAAGNEHGGVEECDMVPSVGQGEGEQREPRRAQPVAGDEYPASVHAVGHRTGGEGCEQPGQELHHRHARHHERVTGQRGDEQRCGCLQHPVGEVRGRLGRPQCGERSEVGDGHDRSPGGNLMGDWSIEHDVKRITSHAIMLLPVRAASQA